MIRFAVVDSSLGNIVLVSKNGRLTELEITDEDVYRLEKRLSALYPDGIKSPESFRKICNLLDRYLRGEKIDFEIDVDISHLGRFTQKVLETLKKIPYGETISYGRLGKQAGYEKAGRAVGQAVGRNPLLIIIPCHRVIKGDGSIGGFSSGLKIKEKLLAVEGIREVKRR